MTKSFLSIVDKDMMNPFGGGNPGFSGGNVKPLNIPAPYPPLEDLTRDGPQYNGAPMRHNNFGNYNNQQ